MKEIIERYSWVDSNNFILRDNITNREIKCLEIKKCVDKHNKEYYPKFLTDEVCNYEFIRWAISTSRIFAKKINFKNNHSSSCFSKEIYAPKELLTEHIQILLIDINANYISKIPDDILTDDVIDYALTKKPSSLVKLPKNLRTKERCEFAVSRSGICLLFVPNDLKTVDLCIKAVLNNPKAIKYVPLRILNPDFINKIIKLGVKIVDEDLEYVNFCLNYHQRVEEVMLNNTYLEGDNINYKNITLDDVSDFFSSKTLTLLKELKIYTLEDLFVKTSDYTFILSFGANKNIINEIYGAVRLLKCKYLDIDPLVDINDDNLSLKDICDMLGLSTHIYNSLAGCSYLYSSKSFFDFMKSPDCIKQLREIKKLGEVSINRILIKANIILNYYAKHNNYNYMKVKSSKK